MWSVCSAGITLGLSCWCFLYPLKILMGLLILGEGLKSDCCFG